MTEVGFNAPQYGYGNGSQGQQPPAPPAPPAPPTPPYPAYPQASYDQQQYAPPAPPYQEQAQDPNYLPPSYADPTANMSDPTMLAPVAPPAAPAVAEPPTPTPVEDEEPVSVVPLVKSPPTDETPSSAAAAPVEAEAPVDATSLVATEPSAAGDTSGSLALPSRPGRVAVQVVDRLGTTGKRGTTTIPPEVIEKIVTVSTREVPGVYAFSGATGTEDGDRAIEVTLDGPQATVSIRLVVEFGYAVPTVTEKVRTKVISALENLFALDVTAVDIAIDDIHIEDSATR